MSSYYKCKDKKFPLTIHTMISYIVTSYGLFGDKGIVFHLSWEHSVEAGTKPYANTFYLINGKLIEYNELKKQKDIFKYI